MTRSTQPPLAANSDRAVDPDFWPGRRVFITGHTGFKGSWLSLWLQSLGAEVQGFALSPPTSPSLFEVARVADGMTSTIGDVRDREAMAKVMSAFCPEVVIHMAAQPMVGLSYEQPVETYATNVMGTVHVLEAARHVDSVRAIVNVTTDKCYENKEWVWGYREDEPMGGHDPYSNSKGCSELVTSAYRRSFFHRGETLLASGRAGNVIGGGDWADSRLVPDVLRSFEQGQSVLLRHPDSIRPWQHVLEPLSGYLTLAQRLHGGDMQSAEAWNFGPRESDARPVSWIVENMARCWGSDASWELDGAEHPHEANYLKLDISKAASRLGWKPRWGLAMAIEMIVEWHRAWLAGADMNAMCLTQIEQYTNTMTKESA